MLCYSVAWQASVYDSVRSARCDAGRRDVPRRESRPGQPAGQPSRRAVRFRGDLPKTDDEGSLAKQEYAAATKNTAQWRSPRQGRYCQCGTAWSDAFAPRMPTGFVSYQHSHGRPQGLIPISCTVPREAPGRTTSRRLALSAASG